MARIDRARTAGILQAQQQERLAEERRRAEESAQRQPGESRQAWRYRTRHLRAAPVER